MSGDQLTPSVAFPALAFFNLLRQPLSMLPEQITNVINASVALGRVQKYMEVLYSASVPVSSGFLIGLWHFRIVFALRAAGQCTILCREDHVAIQSVIAVK